MSTTGDNHLVSAEDFIRVSTAKKRYFGGAMSLRWWYRQIEAGRLPHFRAGATVLLVSQGRLEQSVMELLLANMRVPREREGDLLAQWSANRIAENRLQELSGQYGAPELSRRGAQLMDWTQALLTAALRELPDREVSFSDSLELESGPPASIRVKLARRGPRLRPSASGASARCGGNAWTL